MPAVIEFEHFNLIKVNPKYNDIDFIALMKAKDSIHKLLESTEWPRENFTKEQNLQTLIDDLKQFDLGENFTFHIFNKSEDIIGCVYITPNFSQANQIEFNSFYWLTPIASQSNVKEILVPSISKWLLSLDNVKSINFDMN
jgi:hypothetical protein